MSRLSKLLFPVVAVCLLGGAPDSSRSALAQAAPASETKVGEFDAMTSEARLLTGIRQLTFEGRRAGEGYFSRDGKQLVFQSERMEDNPFFQIYILDLETGDTERISPGIGKTTCAWIHPDGGQVLFASTQDDPAAKEKQEQEFADRVAGTQRRYAWDYDATYELYVYDRSSGVTRRLTSARGYDAEGSWSPDGAWIAFASNRHAYEQPLSEEEQAILRRDPAYFNEIYLMRADGSEIRRLTDVDGYDGGPFFSPDGSRLCWRRFSKDGALAEIMTMNVDGSDQRQLTRLGAMSSAPFYHPSGDYLIFTTNRHGFSNFELYLVDTEARSTPVRVTFTDGFDGLPAFSPDGRQLAWTTNRTPQKQSQIFLANWNDDEARQRLGLAFADEVSAAPTNSPAATDAIDTSEAEAMAIATARQSLTDFRAEDVLRHVDYLCRPELEGRLTGTDGERLATAYVAASMDQIGLQPAGDNGTWYQEFEFTSGISLGDGNRLADGDRTYQVDVDWRPLAFSRTGEVPAAEVVFAGYGIQAPADEDQPEYDSFVHLDVAGKWVVCLRFMPEGISQERRLHLARFASLRFKAMKLRDLGALGMIVVSGPTSKVKQQLVPLRFDGSLAGTSLPVISVTDAVVDEWLQTAGQGRLATVQQALDSGEPQMGIGITGVKLAANVQLVTKKKRGRNVLGVLRMADQPTDQLIAVGAHVDHLGRGTGGSLANEDEVNQIHFGADDNASGVAALLEIAQYLQGLQKAGKFDGKRDILFAAWSGEELGLLGSSHFVESYADEHLPKGSELYPSIAAYLNLDMVGRFEKRLVLQGAGSSSVWAGEIERRNAPVGLPITTQNDSYLPTDASAFFIKGVPILAAFTGSHSEYHTPRDTPEKLNYEDAARIARLIGLVARSLSSATEPPDYIPQVRPEEERPRAGLRAYLGTIPDYAQTDVKGVKLSGVGQGGPAAASGMRSGDVVVELAGKKIENIYDYTYAIDALKIGERTKIVIERDGKRLEFEVTPGSRE